MPSALNAQKRPSAPSMSGRNLLFNANNNTSPLTSNWQPSQGLTWDQLRGQMDLSGVYGRTGNMGQYHGILQQGDVGYDPKKLADYNAMQKYAYDQGWIQPHSASFGNVGKEFVKDVGPVALAALGGYGLSQLGAGAGAAGVSGGVGTGGGLGGVSGLGGTGAFAGMGTGTMATVGGGLASTGAGVGAGTAAGAGGLLGLGLTGKDLLGIGIGGAGTIYAANRANRAASEQADIARQALDMANRPRSTQYGSSVDPSSGTTFIDPSIRAMRERSLGNIPNYQSILSGQLNSSLGKLEDLYGQTNDNAFMDPILQNLALQRGQLSRGLTDRGLGGSSFMSSALGNFESAAAPGIAQARQQGLQARQGILDQSMSTASQGVAQLQNLDNLYANVSGQNLQQELSALGLSQADIGAILGASQQVGAAGQLRNETTGRALDVLGRMFGGANA